MRRGLVAILKRHSDWVMTVAFSPDGKTLASAGRDNNIIFWDVATGKQRRLAEGHRDFVRQVAFSRDGKLLASASADHTIKLWDVTDGHELASQPAHEKTIGGLDVSADGLWIASAGDDGTVNLWDLEKRTPALVMTDHGGPASRVVFLPASRGLVGSCGPSSRKFFADRGLVFNGQASLQRFTGREVAILPQRPGAGAANQRFGVG